MRILVTGGAGFIGSHVVSQLAERGDDVRVLELPGVDTSHLPVGVEVVRGDVFDLPGVANAMESRRAVVHCAANANLWARRASTFDQVNHTGTMTVLQQSKEAPVDRVVHVSSEAVLAGPLGESLIDESVERGMSQMVGDYTRSKWRAEQAARKHGAVIAVPTVPVGPGDRNLTPPGRLIRAFMDGKVPAKVEADLPLVDVRDVAKGIVAALDRGEPGKRYLVAGENWTTTRFFEALAEITGRKAPTFDVPYPVALASGYVSEFVARFTGRQPLSTVEGVRLTRKRLRFDDAWSRRELGLEPRPVMEALRDAVAWFDVPIHEPRP